MALSKTSQKPAKPHKDFPLFPHAVGQWAKKIRGKTHYFGVWADPDTALLKYLEQKDWLQAGLQSPEETGGTQLKDLCNQFLTAKKNRVESGKLGLATWNDYKRTCELIVKTFGRSRIVDSISPQDFSKLRAIISTRFGPVRTSREVTQTRMVFKWGHVQELTQAPRFGSEFVKPSKDVLRRHRQKSPPKMFEAEEIRKMVESATDRTRAWILLGINCAFIQRDLSDLTESSVDLESGYIDFPRRKTAVERRIPLWSETIVALKVVKNLIEDDHYFHTSTGKRLVIDHSNDSRSDAVHDAIERLQRKLKIKKKNRGFSALRHTFRTIAGETCDSPAILRVMGHSDNTISDHYRERIDDERLRKVINHVHDWVFPPEVSET